MFDSRWTYDGKNSSELERTMVVMHGAHHGCLGRKRGALGTSSVVARGGGETDADRRQGVVAAVT
jgi:hypothetical protein